MTAHPLLSAPEPDLRLDPEVRDREAAHENGPTPHSWGWGRSALLALE